MYLSRLIIKNYRSIKDLDLLLAPGKNIIVGKNNSGKSNIFKAIDIVLGENSPTYNKSENVTSEDFFTQKDNLNRETMITVDDLYIACFLTREDGEDLNFDEIDKCSGYYRMASDYDRYSEKRVEVFDFTNEEELKKLFILNHEVQSTSEDGFVSNKQWIDSKIKNQRPFRKELVDKYEFAIIFHAHKNDDLIRKELRFIYRENESENWILCFSSPIRNELLQSGIIPAFRDPDNQLRLASWTWYGKLMKHLTAGKHEDLDVAFNKVIQVSNQIFSTVEKKVKDESLDVAFPGAEIFFQFSDEKKQDLYKSTKIYIDDGIKTVLSNKGAGIQSATIIGLFNYYTKNVNTKTSALLCVEEPELYLHPHARRVISDRLDDFIKDQDSKNKHQVILTTHSSEFVRTTDVSLNMVLVKKNNGFTEANKVNIKELKDLLLDERYTEAFFADKIILCEGHDGYILNWVADEFFPEKMNSQNISVLNVASKDNFQKFVKLILEAKIPCYIFCDFDFILRDKKSEGKIYGKCHDHLGSVGTKFFSQDCIFGKNYQIYTDKIKKIRDDLRNDNLELFYKASTCNELPNSEEVKYVLKDLREHGVGILEGEIENLSKDQTILKPKCIKLSLTKIFQISSEINNGRRISEILETGQITEFLKAVLNYPI